VSPAARDLALEALVGFLVLLLALMLVAIARAPRPGPGRDEAATEAPDPGFGTPPAFAGGSTPATEGHRYAPRHARRRAR
jgi:hypothetical protein